MTGDVLPRGTPAPTADGGPGARPVLLAALLVATAFLALGAAPLPVHPSAGLAVAVGAAVLWASPVLRRRLVGRLPVAGPHLLVLAGAAITLGCAASAAMPFVFGPSYAIPASVLLQDHPREHVRRSVVGALVVGTAVAAVLAAVGPLPPGLGRAGAVQMTVGLGVNTAVLLHLSWRTAVRLRDERRAVHAALRHDARHDALTGLLGRRGLEEHLGATLPAAAPGSGVSVVFLDLDGFKDVNDRHGHDAGDEVLRETARRLADAVGRAAPAGGLSAVLARPGGDEFVVVLGGVHGEAPVERVVDAVRAAVEAEVLLASGATVRVGASTGVATTTAPVALAELVRVADGHMYADKRRRGRAVVSGHPRVGSVPRPRGAATS